MIHNIRYLNFMHKIWCIKASYTITESARMKTVLCKWNSKQNPWKYERDGNNYKPWADNNKDKQIMAFSVEIISKKPFGINSRIVNSYMNSEWLCMVSFLFITYVYDCWGFYHLYSYLFISRWVNKQQMR